MSNDIPLIVRINIFKITFPIDENLLNLYNDYVYDKEIIIFLIFFIVFFF